MLDFEGQRADLGPRVAVAHRTALMIVMGFAVSVGVFVAIAFWLGSRVTETRQTVTPISFYAIAFFLALGSVIFRRTQMHKFRLQGVTTKRGPEGLIRHFVTTTIISAAIGELIGALGLVGSFMTGESPAGLINDISRLGIVRSLIMGEGYIVVRLGVIALAIIFYNYPRRSAWQRAVDYYTATMGTK